MHTTSDSVLTFCRFITYFVEHHSYTRHLSLCTRSSAPVSDTSMGNGYFSYIPCYSSTTCINVTTDDIDLLSVYYAWPVLVTQNYQPSAARDLVTFHQTEMSLESIASSVCAEIIKSRFVKDYFHRAS